MGYWCTLFMGMHASYTAAVSALGTHPYPTQNLPLPMSFTDKLFNCFLHVVQHGYAQVTVLLSGVWKTRQASAENVESCLLEWCHIKLYVPISYLPIVCLIYVSGNMITSGSKLMPPSGAVRRKSVRRNTVSARHSVDLRNSGQLDR